MKATITTGGNHSDERGILTFNNSFDASQVKRIYTVQNCSTHFVRGWQGHTIEQRWFSCTNGRLRIQCVKLDDFENPSKDLPIEEFVLSSDDLDILHVPAGYITAIQTLTDNTKLLSMSDYGLGEVDDVVRFPLNYFNSKR